MASTDDLPDMGAMGPAVTMHQIMLDYMEAGFTRPEAVYIVTATSLGHPGTAPTYDAAAQASGELT